MKFDLLVIKISNVSYCGSDLLCRAGADQVASFMFWLLLMGTFALVSYKSHRQSKVVDYFMWLTQNEATDQELELRSWFEVTDGE